MEQAHELEDERRARFVVVDEEDAHRRRRRRPAAVATLTAAVATTLTAGVGASASAGRALAAFTACVHTAARLHTCKGSALTRTERSRIEVLTERSRSER